MSKTNQDKDSDPHGDWILMNKQNEESDSITERLYIARETRTFPTARATLNLLPLGHV